MRSYSKLACPVCGNGLCEIDDEEFDKGLATVLMHSAGFGSEEIIADELVRCKECDALVGILYEYEFFDPNPVNRSFRVRTSNIPLAI
ncbi:MAG: hypothetical protein ACLUFN_10445 [Eubacterium sp.]